MIQLAKGIVYLHEKNVIHRDLKTDNLLLYDNCRTVKICDFGTVKEIATNNTANTGTPYYMAPEVAISGKYDTKCDVYSFGIIFWEVMSRMKPFYHLGDIPPLTLQNKVSKGDRPLVSDIQSFRGSDTIIKLIKTCWHAKLHKRATMEQVIKTLACDNLDDVILEREPFATGTFAHFYRAKWNTKHDERTIAAKICSYSIHREVLRVKDLLLLGHDNIVTLFGIFEDYYKGALLLMEYADCGSLENVLHENEKKRNYSYRDALNWMHQCVKGMAYLHEKKVIHRRLRPSKLLLMNDFQTLKISILGLTCWSLVLDKNNIPEYIAPETKLTEMTDVYSIGIILWEVMSRKKPFLKMKFLDIEDVVKKGARPDLKDANIFENSEPIKDLITGCWHSDPQKRPTMKDLILSLGDILLSE
ncbi:mitogen-activated protein kinase kinase kinase 7-like [Drosophila innubila]|uniref:mitogen-activated protein kinase kinase kinase 7-like n=1 Tax=Drosophila innubila TaxID=198719 RepID=UPI00148C97D6|nr:mitogen-activated protein kinase kinase kinase 7-like [Drosophila innubila]